MICKYQERENLFSICKNFILVLKHFSKRHFILYIYNYIYIDMLYPSWICQSSILAVPFCCVIFRWLTLHMTQQLSISTDWVLTFLLLSPSASQTVGTFYTYFLHKIWRQTSEKWVILATEGTWSQTLTKMYSLPVQLFYFKINFSWCDSWK